MKQALTQEPCAFPPGFDLAGYQIYQRGCRRALQDGDVIGLGGREVTVLHTPGHSPGHCCFYEAARGSLYTGDLAYGGCLYAFYPTTDPRQFFRSVQKVADLPVKNLYPGHHKLDIPASLLGRVEEAFRSIDAKGQLRQGQGVFRFDGFQIHI